MAAIQGTTNVMRCCLYIATTSLKKKGFVESAIYASSLKFLIVDQRKWKGLINMRAADGLKSLHLIEHPSISNKPACLFTYGKVKVGGKW